ncbi:response regulator transcription factor [Pseudomonas helleri]|uniref:response regulator transcription factor n=1 Tax=Pseudomonas helleri TaxID=1608996 RepID=UPI000653B6B6|nr:response regulator transcription factor [Pseudomonas helleri]
MPSSTLLNKLYHEPTRVIIADDHPVVLIGTRISLSTLINPTTCITHEASTPETLIQLLEQEPCDLVVTDFFMPSENFPDGLALISYIRRNFPHVKLLVMTMMKNPMILRQLLKLGVTCLLDKHSPAEEFKSAVRAAIQGRCHLSPSFGLVLRSPKKGEIINSRLSIKELEVVRLFAQDLSGREIARRLNRSEKTISRQKRSAMNKLDIQSNSQLAAFGQSF